MSKKSDNQDVDEVKEPISLKPCFIITPIGELNSEINIKARGLIDTVMRPELEKFNFFPLPAYKIADAGSINKQVLENIISNELVIVNLTGLNPNVMYELAVRHAVRLPVITMAEVGTKLPFDIVDQRTIFYNDSLAGSLVAREKLFESIEAVLKLETIDNPIYQVSQEISILKKDAKSEDFTMNQYLIKRFDQMESAIANINNSLRPNSQTKSFINLYQDSEFPLRSLKLRHIGVGEDPNVAIENVRKILNQTQLKTEGYVVFANGDFQFDIRGKITNIGILVNTIKALGFEIIGGNLIPPSAFNMSA
ncbi:MAG: hypothetical protein ABIN91_15955 [Mucilaginibacter sp.]|uniref:hypothetical protein n=1 Tax=Mucilaginibacter sp. TaxID=1882438 RepID=UPI00326598CC